jgi:IS5 family transposase
VPPKWAKLNCRWWAKPECQNQEEIDYSILYRWFVGLNLDEGVWDATTFTKNRDRLLEASVAKEFLAQVVEQARAAGLISDEHFTVDGTLLEAWASLKSFQPKNKQEGPPPDDTGNPTVDFHGQKRSNETHESKTDPDALLARKGKGKEAKLSYNGDLLIENRNGLIVNAELLQANGRAERDAALVMLEQVEGNGHVTVGGDKGYDTAEFVDECRHMNVTPHVAQNTARPGGSAIDARTTRHAGYDLSQKKRKRIEECFGWLKDIALMRKLKHRGLFKVGWIFTFAAAAYNLVRMRKLIPIPATA